MSPTLYNFYIMCNVGNLLQYIKYKTTNCRTRHLFMSMAHILNLSTLQIGPKFLNYMRDPKSSNLKKKMLRNRIPQSGIWFRNPIPQKMKCMSVEALWYYWEMVLRDRAELAAIRESGNTATACCGIRFRKAESDPALRNPIPPCGIETPQV